MFVCLPDYLSVSYHQFVDSILPFRDRLYFAHNDGTAEQSTIYFKDLTPGKKDTDNNDSDSNHDYHGTTDEEENPLGGATPLFVDVLPPGASLRQVAFSDDGQYIAFSYNAG